MFHTVSSAKVTLCEGFAQHRGADPVDRLHVRKSRSKQRPHGLPTVLGILGDGFQPVHQALTACKNERRACCDGGHLLGAIR